VNLIFISVAPRLSFDAQNTVRIWKEMFHVVEEMRHDSLVSYLHFHPAAALAQVDAIVCDCDVATSTWISHIDWTPTSPVETAIKIADDVRRLPHACAMRDGRKWRSIPFIIITSAEWLSSAMGARTHAKVLGRDDPWTLTASVQAIVDEDHQRLLEDYHRIGILIRIHQGRTQIQPAHQRNNSDETELYYPKADIRKNKVWTTVKRDEQGVRLDLEQFRDLLDRRAPETEMHKFFEQHPNILMEARRGVPLSHAPRFAVPKGRTLDYLIYPIIGPFDGRASELLELKGPAERLLRKGDYGGFTAKVHSAVNQVRDYGEHMADPRNMEAIRRGIGFVPNEPKRAVLIGRAPGSNEETEVLRHRQHQLADVEIVTYDDIFETQVKRAERDRHSYRLITNVLS
jgi:hypothetical protein